MEIFDAYSSIEETSEMAHKLATFTPKSNTNQLEMTEKNDTIFDSDNKSIFMRERDICLFPFFAVLTSLSPVMFDNVSLFSFGTVLLRNQNLGIVVTFGPHLSYHWATRTLKRQSDNISPSKDHNTALKT